MARTTLPPQAEAAESQIAQAATTTTSSLSSSSLPMPGLPVILRVITLAFLVLAISLLASNSTTVTVNNASLTTHFNDIYAYRYAVSTAAIGLSYTFLLLLYSIQQTRAGKPAKTLLHEFIGDKVVFALLGTGVGAALGATVELKAKMDDVENAIELNLPLGYVSVFAPIVSKYDDFFSRAYIPAVFLLIAFLTSGLSSLLSSLALTTTATAATAANSA